MSTVTTVPIGEIRMARRVGVLRTLLGSCVGVALYHRPTRTATLAHALLADSSASSGSKGTSFGRSQPGRYVDTAIREMLRKIKVDARAVGDVVAHLAGGAEMLAAGPAESVGEQNQKAALGLLHHLRIELVSENCGGRRARRMTIDASDGRVLIETISVTELQRETGH
ncbi:MAG: chemotaxis protein CheD [Planctomycetota bacterium]